MNALIENRHGRRELLRQPHDACILPRPSVGQQQQAEGLLALVLPDVLSTWIQLARIVLREDGAARDRDSHIVILHAVTVLGVIDDSEPILLPRAVAGKIDPSLPGIFFAFSLPHLVAVSDFVS